MLLPRAGGRRTLISQFHIQLSELPQHHHQHYNKVGTQLQLLEELCTLQIIVFTIFLIFAYSCRYFLHLNLSGSVGCKCRWTTDFTTVTVGTKNRPARSGRLPSDSQSRRQNIKLLFVRNWKHEKLKYSHVSQSVVVKFRGKVTFFTVSSKCIIHCSCQTDLVNFLTTPSSRV